MAVSVLMTSFGAFAVWDGSEKDRPKADEAGQSLTMKLVDMDSMNLIKESNASPSVKYEGSANYTAHWNNHKIQLKI